MPAPHHTIRLNNIRLYAHHGCLEEEAIIGGHYTVDVALHTDFAAAAQTDDLSKTIDYVTVSEIVHAEMAIRSHLIEHVAQRIVNSLKQRFSSAQTVWVKVTKINAPIAGQVESVSVEMEA